MDDLITRMVTNPRRIFCLPEQLDTFIEVDSAVAWDIHASQLHTRCGWTPFEGYQVRGRVRRVTLRGKEAFRDGQVLAIPGFGKDVRKKRCGNQD
jgi:carbamoyl-phosphate synthase/aspartate carbamoyltransferase/dihydroorotase